MSANVHTRHISFSRDNLLQTFSKPDVFEKNLMLASCKEDVDGCIKKYRDDITAKGCSCRANPALLFDCFDKVLARLEELKINDVEAVKTFIYYATNQKPRENERIELTVYFRKGGADADLHKYVFTT
jgi:hypothetical protein